MTTVLIVLAVDFGLLIVFGIIYLYFKHKENIEFWKRIKENPTILEDWKKELQTRIDEGVKYDRVDETI